MNRSTHQTLKSSFLFSAFLGGVLLTSCSHQTSQLDMRTASMPSALPAAEMAVNEVAQAPAPAPTPATADATAAKAPQTRPQLIKTAEIALSVNSIDQSLQEVSQIVKQQQGDVLGFQDQKPQDQNSRHTASMQIRVPQQLLESTLESLAKLGTVQRRTLTAEDVTDQLVDIDARLRNLRKQESTLLKIMERSGSVGDVLKVAQELNNVRQTIEQIDAQLKNLRGRVAYSMITLQLEQDVAGIPAERPLGSRVQETWNQSTHTMNEFMIGLVLLGTGLLPWTPVFLLIGGAAYGYTRFRKQQSQAPVQQPEPPNVS